MMEVKHAKLCGVIQRWMRNSWYSVRKAKYIPHITQVVRYDPTKDPELNIRNLTDKLPIRACFYDATDYTVIFE